MILHYFPFEMLNCSWWSRISPEKKIFYSTYRNCVLYLGLLAIELFELNGVSPVLNFRELKWLGDVGASRYKWLLVMHGIDLPEELVVWTFSTDSWLCDFPLMSSLGVIGRAGGTPRSVLLPAWSWLTVIWNSCLPAKWVELFVFINILCRIVGEEWQEEE